MLQILAILLIIALVGVWIWNNKRDWVLQLLGKDPDSLRSTAKPQPVTRSAAPKAERSVTEGIGQGEGEPRKLSPLDVPMIQARFEKLGIWEHLNEHQSDVLRRTILEHCKEGKVELWWSPLIEFARYLDYQKGEMPAMIMDASKLQAVEVRKRLFGMDYRLRRSGLALEDITSAKGDELDPDHVLTDGTYKVIYKVRERAFRFPVKVENGQLDMRGLVRTLNGLCERKRAKGRFLLLPPTEPIWCVVYTLFTTAEQVQRSRWAELPLPRALTEDDVERVSEDLHSAVPDKPADEASDKKPFELAKGVEELGEEPEDKAAESAEDEQTEVEPKPPADQAEPTPQ